MNETNYCARVLDDSAAVIRNVQGKLGAKWAALYAAMYARLGQCVKFRLPDNGSILGLSTNNHKDSIREFHRLPYPNIALEYRMEGPVSSDQQDVPQRVLMCWETGDEAFPIGMQLFVMMDGLWTPYSSGCVISSDAENMRVQTNFPKELVGDKYDQYLVNAQQDMSADGVPLAEFLAAIACSNVETQDNEPPPALNRKRVARGRTPFFTYKTLVLRTNKESGHGAATGGHSSPRIHLRRGHIRRLPDKRVWVNACVVGDKSLGMAAKDYAVQ